MVFRYIRLFLLIFILSSLSITTTGYEGTISVKDITHAANFYADYIDVFGEPPNVLIINKEKIDLAQAIYLFSSAVSNKNNIKLINIKGYNDNFITNAESDIKTEDIIAVSELYTEYLEKYHELPYLVKINNIFITNADFIYLLADMLRYKYNNNIFPEIIKNKKLYSEDIIDWNSKHAKSKKRHIIFTVDYEADRPVYSKEYDKFSLKKQVNTTKDQAINPRFIQNICYDQFCILPDDYGEKKYTSEEIAWFTTILNSSGDITSPSCYPFCGTINGTDIIINEFILKYNFPMVWFMTGRSIIALANSEKIDRMKGLQNNGLLDLSIHTMYHTNMKNVSPEFLTKTLKENTKVFMHVFNTTPIEFRSPYLNLAKDNEHIEILNSLNVSADNEIIYISPYCEAVDKCNYEFNISNVHISRIDWKNNENDPLLNIFLMHPWDLLLDEKGSPTHLEFSETTNMDSFKNWMLLTGKYGLIPTLSSEVMEK